MSVESVLIITCILLLIAFLVTLGVLVWVISIQDSRERKYINAVLANDVQEYTKAEIAQREIVKDEDEIEKTPSFVVETELSDEDWFKSIEQN